MNRHFERNKMFLYQDLQISTGGTLRFKFETINNRHVWSVELREDPGWGNVKYLYKKDITHDAIQLKTYDVSFELPQTVTSKHEIAYYDNLEVAIYYSLFVLNKNK